jgi:trk system potassium uptake protein TrkA
MRTVFSAGNGEVEIYEFTVPAAWEGRKIEELLPDNECSVAALTRAGRALLPGCDMILQQGDIVLISATFEAIEKLRQQLHLSREV